MARRKRKQLSRTPFVSKRFAEERVRNLRSSGVRVFRRKNVVFAPLKQLRNPSGKPLKRRIRRRK